MAHILQVTFPFFALVLIGWAVARRGWLPLESIPALNLFVLYFALPCMLFRFGSSTPVLQLLNPSVLAVYLVCALAVVGFTIAVTLSDAVNLKDAAFGALVAAFPNTGFMGVPLLVALLGPAAAGPAICTITADLVITSTLCLALAEAHGAAGHGIRSAVPRILKGVAKNPMPWSIALGVLFLGERLTTGRIGGLQVLVPVAGKVVAASGSPVRGACQTMSRFYAEPGGP